MSLSEQLTRHTEERFISASKTATLTGAGASGASFAAGKPNLMSFLSMDGPEVLNACAMLGAVVAVLGFIVNVYFQWRRDRRHEQALQQSHSSDKAQT